MTLRMLRVAIVSSKRDTHGASGISFYPTLQVIKYNNKNNKNNNNNNKKIITIIDFTAYFICGLVMTVVLESGIFKTVAYKLNIGYSLNSIPTISANHNMCLSVSVLV